MEREIQGQNVSKEQLDEWVAEAEKGYDIAWLQKRMVRPAWWSDRVFDAVLIPSTAVLNA
ncbi:hypothetical protein [Dietzia sp. PP-33]|jgi:hypothetical protein|uniref:hypothetical protein n=1 Tax=Dietzia sp. PP-33 TaxID=2957500 RepID=UPI0029AC330A|nr:hypothetical protein [Dietzia sp. PP-33]MDX2355979.1 hypothetical protein [Dietzia sp. PP-33]